MATADGTAKPEVNFMRQLPKCGTEKPSRHLQVVPERAETQSEGERSSDDLSSGLRLQRPATTSLRCLRRAPLSALTPREQEVGCHILLGQCSEAISQALGSSVHSALTCRKRAYPEAVIGGPQMAFGRGLHSGYSWPDVASSRVGGPMPQTLVDEISKFFDNYNRAFAERDGAAISMFYSVPSVSMRGDRSTHCFQSREDLVAFFQEVSDRYEREGASGARFLDLAVQPIGGRSVLATLEWQNTRPDGSVVRKWRQSYNLIRPDDRWQIFVSTFHVE